MRVMIALDLMDWMLTGLGWSLAIACVCCAIFAFGIWKDATDTEDVIGGFLVAVVAAATGYWAYLAHPAFDEVGITSGASSTGMFAPLDATGVEGDIEDEANDASTARAPSDQILRRIRECRRLLDEDIPAAYNETVSAIRETSKTIDAGRVPRSA